MTKILHTVFLIIVLVTTQGCGQNVLSEKLIPKAEVAFAKHYFSLFQNEDYETLTASIDTNLKNADLRKKLKEIAAFFPKEPPKKIDVVGSNTFKMADKSRFNLAFQYEFSESWLIANIFLERIGDGELVVKGVNVRPLPDSLQHINRFTLKDKSIAHYVFLVITAFIALFIVVTFVFCLRTPIKKRKWLWAIIVLFGIGQCTINWTSGAISYHLLSLNLFGTAVFYGNAFSPVMVKMTLPLGAIIFWIKRRSFYRNRDF